MQDPRRSTQDPPAQAPNGAAAAHASRCVVWCVDPAGPPTRLLASLARNGLSVEVCQTALDASAALARRARSPGLTVLVLVEPDELPDSQRLASMVERRWPGVRCWEYRGVLGRRSPTQDPGLEPRADRRTHTPRPAGPEPVVVVPVRRQAEPALRLAGTAPASPSPVDRAAQSEFSDDAESAPPAYLLTDAELAMLLDAEPEAPDPR